MKRLPKRAPLLAGVGLLAASMLAVAGSQAIDTLATAGRAPAASIDVKQRQIGTGAMSAKSTFNLRARAATAMSSATAPRASGPRLAVAFTATGFTPLSATPLSATPVSATPVSATPVSPRLDEDFDALQDNGSGGPPDPNAAAGPTQIVEVVNSRIQVYNRTGFPLFACTSTSLPAFIGAGAGETVIDPRVIYDNVANRFTVIVGIQAPPPPPIHLPGTVIMRIAHSDTADACGGWTRYSLNGLSSDGNNIPDGSFVDQPAIGQDRNAFLFSGGNFTPSNAFLGWVEFALPKSCAYTGGFCTFPIFRARHYATPTSNGGAPMIATASSYFVASVPGVGYELYRMDNTGDTTRTTLVLQATVGTAPEVQTLATDAAQPGPNPALNLNRNAAPGEVDTRITSTPTYDGTRIWFAHTTRVSNHAAVRYGAINTATNTVVSSLALHSPTSDDFNPSIAVGISGTTRNIFLNWVYTDEAAGLPLSIAVAEVVAGAADPLTPVNGTTKHLTLSLQNGVTHDDRFGDYSSTMIDPVNPNQVCAVSANEYFDITGKWATRISRFGAAGC